jgi:hypothetical protein
MYNVQHDVGIVNQLLPQTSKESERCVHFYFIYDLKNLFIAQTMWDQIGRVNNKR